MSGLRHRLHIVPDTWVTLPPVFWEGVMPWKECSVMDERLQFVARRLANGGSLQGVWDFAQDRLQDLRSLPGVWGARVDGPKPTTLPLCESTSLPGGKFHPEREARALQLGCPQDSRAPPAQILRNSHPGQEHHPCGARSPWPGRAPRSFAPSCAGNRFVLRPAS